MEDEADTRRRKGAPRTFAANPALFPCQLSEPTAAASKAAVKAAVAAWGEYQLNLLEAEDRLSVACEKGTTSDPVILGLRQAYQVGEAGAGQVAMCLAGLSAARCRSASPGLCCERQ